VPRVGLKTVKSRFPFMVDEKVQSVETLAEHCRNVAKPISVHTKILGNLELIQKNYDIMQLYEPVISGTNQRSINYIVDNFEPEFNKLAFTKLLMEDGQITMNLDRLYLIFKKIIS
jgi:hypothetical protein